MIFSAVLLGAGVAIGLMLLKFIRAKALACQSCEALSPQPPFYSPFLHTTLSNPTANSHATIPTTRPLTKASPKADKLALSCKPKAQNRTSTNPTHNPNATKLAPCHKLQRWRVQAAGLPKKFFTYFVISRLDKSAFFWDIIAILTANNMKKFEKF